MANKRHVTVWIHASRHEGHSQRHHGFNTSQRNPSSKCQSIDSNPTCLIHLVHRQDIWHDEWKYWPSGATSDNMNVARICVLGSMGPMWKSSCGGTTGQVQGSPQTPGLSKLLDTPDGPRWWQIDHILGSVVQHFGRRGLKSLITNKDIRRRVPRREPGTREVGKGGLQLIGIHITSIAESTTTDAPDVLMCLPLVSPAECVCSASDTILPAKSNTFEESSRSPHCCSTAYPFLLDCLVCISIVALHRYSYQSCGMRQSGASELLLEVLTAEASSRTSVFSLTSSVCPVRPLIQKHNQST